MYAYRRNTLNYMYSHLRITEDLQASSYDGGGSCASAYEARAAASDEKDQY